MGQQFVPSQQKETNVSAVKTFIFIFSTINSLILLGLFSSPKTYQNINLVYSAKQLEVFTVYIFQRQVPYVIEFCTLLLQKELIIIYCVCKTGTKMSLVIGEGSVRNISIFCIGNPDSGAQNGKSGKRVL